MRVAITGASGLIGSALADHLRTDGHDVLRLVRRSASRPDEISWDPAQARLHPSDLRGTDAVVHLAGAPITATWWTAAKKRRIRDSRVDSTRLLAETIAAMDDGPRTLVVASGISWYGERGGQTVTEHDEPGSGFLAAVTRDWEAAADPAREVGIRVAHSRNGVVLGGGDRLLTRLAPLFRMGLGTRVGFGEQWFTWVSIDDMVAALARLITDDSLSGAFNVTAPNPVTMAEFAQTLGRVLGRPAFLVVPAVLPRLLLGQSARETLLISLRVLPGRLQQAGFEWQYPELEPALRHILNRPAPEPGTRS